jgi:nuclear cap-binding protein subunit 1
MRRIVDLEVRLAYHDRILETLPEPMTQDASVISDAPDPVWPYEQEGESHCCSLSCSEHASTDML